MTERTDTFFDPWLALSRPDMNRHPLTAVVLDELAAGETRMRSRKEGDRRTHEALVDTIVANLAWAIRCAHAPHAVAWPLARPTGAADRYGRPGLRSLKATLEAMERCGLLDLRLSRERRQASTFQPSPRLRGVIAAHPLSDCSFLRLEGQETIRLCRAERDHASRSIDRTLIDYRDTPETMRLRADLAAINDHLAAADLAFLGNDPTINPSRRRMHRVFNLPAGYPEDEPRFDMGGRLFGAWWEVLGSSRRPLIRINGEPVMEVDFSALFTRLAYLHMGEAPPPGDLYRSIRGIVTDEHRDGVKQVLNALWFRTKPLTRLPKGSKALLPAELQSAPAITRAILDAHGALAGAFAQGIGYRFFRTESDIMVAVLLRLNEQGVTALPLHDGLLIAASSASLAAEVMEEVASEIVGYRLPVAMKPSKANRKSMRAALRGSHKL